MKSPIRLSPSLSRLIRRFSSAPSPPTGGSPSRPPAGESLAYRMSMLRPPATVRPWKVRWNACSFIGTVVRPVQRFASAKSSGVYTFLDVNSPSDDSDASSFRILLVMWHMLAETSLRYLKPKDFIYVHGPLGSYGKVDQSGKREILYKVAVMELNYVKRSDRTQTSGKAESSTEDEMDLSTSGAFDQEWTPQSSAWDCEKEHRDHLHLWQLFFSNPCEWWDNRLTKQNPRAPDFKHKDTGECLWLNPDDPPWVRKQLQLYDSKMVGGCQRVLSGRSHEWKLNDLE